LLTSHSAHNATFARVVVGKKAQLFTIHLELLTHYSPFFHNALKGSFKEAHEKLVTLPDTSSRVVELFVHWLYHQRLPTKGDSPQLLAMYLDDKDAYVQLENLVDLYIFCDKYDVPKLKRLCLDAAFQHLEEEHILPNFPTARILFENLEADRDPLCRLWVDQYCYYSVGGIWAPEDIQTLPPTFVIKVLDQYANCAHGGRDTVGAPELCNYHHHATAGQRELCEQKREMAEQAKELLAG
jgi:hypothetical protein